MSDLCKYINNAYTDANPFIAICTIVHDDPAIVSDFQFTYPNGREGISPDAAALIYAAVVVGAVAPPWPYRILPTFPFGLDPTVAGASQAASTVIDTCGNRVAYRWVTFLVLSGGGAVAPPGAEAIRQRRFIVGWEMPGAEASAGGSLTDTGIARHASRVPNGLGMVIRSNANQFCRMLLTRYSGGGASPFKDSWERFYLRPFQFDAVVRRFWRCYGNLFPQGGAALHVQSSGVIQIAEIDQTGAFVVLHTTTATIPMNRWSRFDIVVSFGNGGATSGRLRLWLNGVQLADVTSTLVDGLGQNGNHEQTDLGIPDNVHNCEIDVDDWINAESPVLFNGMDWLSGSHVRHVKPNGDGAGRTGWTGDWRIGLQLPTVTAQQQLASTTANARLELATDAAVMRAFGEYQQGVVAALIAGYVGQGGGSTGQLGFSISGVDNLQAITVPNAPAFRTVGHFPSGLTAPLTIDPFAVIYVRDASAALNNCRSLQAVVECLGTWGIEDPPPDISPPPDITPVIDSGIHNNPYWEHSDYRGGPGAAPFGEVSIESGVYSGNSTGQDLPKVTPGHWLFVRRVTGGSGRSTWFSSMIATHVDTTLMRPETMVQALIEAGTPKMRVAGAPVEANAAGSTYQWITMSDPAMRYLLCGAFAHHSPQTVGAGNPLIDSTYFPEAGFFWVEDPTGFAGGDRFYYKGIGHATANAQAVDVGETANVVTFGLGNLFSQTPFHPTGHKVAYCLLRLTDGGGAPGSPNCDPDNTGSLAALTSYVGNGAGNRTIPVALNGRRPLFAIVQPHNAFARFKDPSHITTDTGRVDNGSSSGAEILTGGVNFIEVAGSLNVTGIVYEVFVLPGDIGGTGWSGNGTFYPVPPGAPCGPIWPPTPTPPEPPVPPGSACAVNFPTDLS